eukprot:1128267-Rhodomonas_salina.3
MSSWDGITMHNDTGQIKKARKKQDDSKRENLRNCKAKTDLNPKPSTLNPQPSTLNSEPDLAK